jgi:probable phosphoglycerate mutase
MAQGDQGLGGEAGVSAAAASIGLFRRPFCFVRHGETESNLRHTIAGSLDVALTERGRAQARAAAAAIGNRKIGAIYSSGLVRAHETALIIGAGIGLPVTVIADLAERNWGELEGRPRALQAQMTTPPGAESPQEFAARVVRGLGTIATAGLPLVVAHSGVFRVLCRTLGIDEPADPVANCRPLRFEPPDGNNPVWRIEAL